MTVYTHTELITSEISKRILALLIHVVLVLTLKVKLWSSIMVAEVVSMHADVDINVRGAGADFSLIKSGNIILNLLLSFRFAVGSMLKLYVVSAFGVVNPIDNVEAKAKIYIYKIFI